MGCKLEIGYYGGNCEHYGAHSYRGFDVCVSHIDGDTPIKGQSYTVGLYKENDDSGDAIALLDFYDFNIIHAQCAVDSMIDGLLAEAKTSIKKECTCGAKHTSNPNFHTNWCDKSF